jgi:small subunit ribosomal protein S5
MARRNDRRNQAPRRDQDMQPIAWTAKTELGRKVKGGEITDIDDVLTRKQPLLEAGIVDDLLPGMESDLLMIGQSKGKFGGGARRVFRQTQKKTKEGNKPHFAAYCVIGNKDGIIGLGYGKAKETVPAREKAVRRAKLNVFRIARGSGSWESTTSEPHSIPFAVTGRSGSVRITLMPAPKGKGLVCEKEVAKILRLAGVKDVWSYSFGQQRNKVNLIKATEDALRKLSTTRMTDKALKATKFQEGRVNVRSSTD